MITLNLLKLKLLEFWRRFRWQITFSVAFLLSVLLLIFYRNKSKRMELQNNLNTWAANKAKEIVKINKDVNQELIDEMMIDVKESEDNLQKINNKIEENSNESATIIQTSDDKDIDLSDIKSRSDFWNRQGL